MTRRIGTRALGLALAVLLSGAAIVVAVLVWKYLSTYPIRAVVSILVLLLGFGVAIIAGVGVSRTSSKRAALSALALAGALVLIPAVSFLIGAITYSRFGLTVYGLLPIPVLDITVNARGHLGFRDKTHLITLEEVTPLLQEHVEVIIVGIGFDGIAEVEDSVRTLEGYEVHVLRTPEAINLYRELSSTGRSVVLLAHSTC